MAIKQMRSGGIVMADKGYLKYVNTRMGSRSEPRFSNGNTLPFA